MALKDLPDSRLIWLIDKASKAVLVLLSLVILIYFSGFWLSEWLVSFLPQVIILVLGMFMVIASLYLRFLVRDGFVFIRKTLSKTDAAILVITAALFLWIFSLSYYSYDLSASDKGNQLRVGSYNALVDSNTVEEGYKFFNQQSSEIVFLQEVDQEDIDFVSEKLGYSHTFRSECKCSAGDSDVAIISKYPLTNNSKIFESPFGAIIKSEVEEKDLVVLGVHLTAPVNPEYLERRNQMLDLVKVIIADLNQANKKFVIAGDFNTTAYSHIFKSTFSEAKLATDRFWPRCTWYGYSAVLCTAIDHIIVSKQINVTSISYGEISSSDHRPISAVVEY